MKELKDYRGFRIENHEGISYISQGGRYVLHCVSCVSAMRAIDRFLDGPESALAREAKAMVLVQRT